MALTPAELDAQVSAHPVRFDKLEPSEHFWVDHQPWLESCGYQLRPRYSPDWVASWPDTARNHLLFEDGHSTLHGGVVMDAVRLSDGAFLALKKTRPSKNPEEVNICLMFTAEPSGSDAHNHCVPVYEVLRVPDDADMVLLVMPFLSDWSAPKFHTVGEVVDFVVQAIEGLQFIHRQNVAHRDCKANNILMDSRSLYLEPAHPVIPWMKRDWTGQAQPLTRAKRPVKYYIVDFGLSKQYPAGQPRALDPPYFGGDQTVPEFRAGAPCDSFAVDVYCLGNVFREELTHGKGTRDSPGLRGLGFLRPLVEDMVQDDPKLRPTMDQVAERFDRMRFRLHWWTLHARPGKATEGAGLGFLRNVVHWTKLSLTLGR
ncbi:kinase-like domain-containing protein [Mycena filopes]|nr:kinase-like domain-containing protein [Mycena filopes]